jgi:hypothetical protein
MHQKSISKKANNLRRKLRNVAKTAQAKINIKI